MNATLRSILIATLAVCVSTLGQAVAATSLVDGLRAHWDFEECSGSVVHDVSGNGNDGLNVGGLWTPGAPCGCALDLSADDAGVFSIPTHYDDTLTGELTIATWIKWHGPVPAGCYILDGRASGGGEIRHGMHFVINRETEKAGFQILCGLTPEYITVFSNASVPVDIWTHIVGVFSLPCHTLAIYINGELDNLVMGTHPYCPSSQTAAIGNNHWGPPWAPLNGTIDDLRIYDRALSDQEIRSLYEECATASTPDPGLVRTTPNPPLSSAPNPARTTTEIRYTVPPGCELAVVDLTVYDSGGRVVRRLARGTQTSGECAVLWDGRNEEGRQVPQGIYWYELKAPNVRQARKLVFLR